MSLAERLELAAEALPADADAIRPANGDPHQLLNGLDAAAAGRVLQWLLANGAQDCDELLGAWMDEPAGLEAIAGIDESGLPKPGRKALRRALHSARSRGLAIPTVSQESARVARLPSIDEDLGAAYVSPYDPRGGRLVYIVESRPSGGARVFEVLLDEDRGVVDFQVYRAGRSQVRDFVRDVTRRERFPSVLADVDAVRSLIARALERQPADRPLPKSLGEWRSKLVHGAEGSATPGEQTRAALGDAADEADHAAGVAIVDAREIGPWPPQPERLEALVQTAEAAVADHDPSDAAGLNEALEVQLRAGLSDAYAGDCAASTAERFEETAYLYWKGGQASAARAFLAAASALRDGDTARSPVVEALLRMLRMALLEDLANRMLARAGDDPSDVDDPEVDAPNEAEGG
jgi:hypothetical protein